MSKCIKGTSQSPINIETGISVSCGALCDLVFYYRHSACELKNVNKNIVFAYDNGSYVMYNNEIFELDQVTFFTPSCHKIDSEEFPLEINLNHRSPNTGKKLIISIMCDVNESASKSYGVLDVIAGNFPQPGKLKTISTSSNWNIFDALPEIKSFYSYQGSLPRAPCDEDVTWIIFENTINCSTKFYNTLNNKIGNNTRPLQPLNARKIYYNANNSKKNNRNYGSNFRCYTEKEFNNACSCLNTQVDTIRDKNRLALMGIILAILVIIILLIILYFVEKKGGISAIRAGLKAAQPTLNPPSNFRSKFPVRPTN